jgi:multidrug resistance efflux pump
MNDAPITRDAPSRRKHYRVTAPILVGIDRVERPTLDWSVGGFRVMGMEGEFTPGQEIAATISIPFQGVFISSRQTARVVRFNPETGDLACEFVNLDGQTRDLLNYFFRALVSGEMASIDGMVKRIDIPVTPVKREIKDEWRGLPWTVRVRRLLTGAVYLLAGIVVAAYLAATLYSHLYRVNVETGVVTVPRDELAAPFGGVLEKIMAPAGSVCAAGQPLLALRDQELLDDIETERLAVKAAQTALAEITSKLAAHAERVSVYRQIAERQLTQSGHKVAGLSKEAALAKSDCERQAKLLERKAVTAVAYEQAASNLARLEKKLEMAQQEQSIAEYNLKALDSGFFFTGNELQGEHANLTAEVETASRQVALCQERLANAEAKLPRMIVNAPFDGRVLKYAVPLGTMVAKGAPLVFLEESVPPVVESHLTQEEVARIRLGGEAVVFIPPLDRRFPATVASIDRTTGYSDARNYDYQWREVDERTALATLGIAPEHRRGLSAGMPAIVNFERHHDNRLLLWIKVKVVVPVENRLRAWFERSMAGGNPAGPGG